VIGQPTEVEGARQLAQSPEGRYQFLWWALTLVDARPIRGVEKKGADRGSMDESHSPRAMATSRRCW
jgi:hypothetical protein